MIIPVFYQYPSFSPPLSPSSTEDPITDPMHPFFLPIGSICRDASNTIAINRPKNCYLCHPTSLLSPVSRILHRCIHILVYLSTMSLLSCISNAVIVLRTSPPPALSYIPIILHLYRVSIVILLCLCCGPHLIIFNFPAYVAAVVCLPYRIRSSPCSALFYTTLLNLLCLVILLSFSNLIFSLRFFLLSWHGSSIYM